MPGDRLPDRRRPRRAGRARRRDRRGRPLVLRPSGRREAHARARASRTLGLPAYRPLRSERLAASLGQRDARRPEGVARLGPGRARLRLAGSAARAARPVRGVLTPLCPGSASACAACSRSRSASTEDWFEDTFRDHSSSMRVINYPAPEVEPEPGQLRAGAHTDYGCMTILRTEESAGRAAGSDPRRRMARRPRRPRLVRRQPRRHDGALDERPVGRDAPPCRRASGGPRAAAAAARRSSSSTTRARTP